MSEPNQIIKTMITQFCGNISRLVIMLGTKQVLFDNATNMIKFNFPMRNKANYCVIRYDSAMDTYSLEFCRFNNKSIEWETIESFNDVYCDQLTEIFEDFTGLTLNYNPQFISL